MSKRFFSLLLVLAMVFSFALPAMASEEPTDEPAVATVGGFHDDLVVKKNNQAARQLEDLVDDDEGFYKYDNETLKYYNPDSFADFKAAYEAAKKIIDDYDQGVNTAPTDADMNAKRTALDGKDNISTDAIASDYEAVKTKITEAKAFLATVKKGDQYTALETAINDAQSVIDSYTNNATKATRWALCEYDAKGNIPKTGAGHINKINAAMDEAKDYVVAATVKIKSLGINATGQQLTVTLTGADTKKDNNDYGVIVSVNGANARYPQNANVFTPKAAATTMGAIDVTLNPAGMGVTTFAIKDGDVITVTLYTCAANPNYQEGISKVEDAYVLTQVDQMTITYKANATAGVKYVLSVEYKAADNKFAATLDQAAQGGDKLNVEVKSPKGKVAMIDYGAQATKDIAWEADLKVALAEKDADDNDIQPAGDYSFQLYKTDSNNVRAAVGDPVVVTVKAVDTADLEALVKKLDDIGTDKLASDYGNFTAVSDVAKALKAAKYWLAAGPYVNITYYADQYSKADKSGVLDKLQDAYAAIYDVTEMKALVEECLALDPADYTNWKTGTMAEVLLDARYALLRATTSPANLGTVNVDYDGDGANDNITRRVIGKDDFNDALAALKAAKAALISEYADTNALQALIDAAPTDGEKYTEASWKALQDAIAAAKAVIEAKPGADEKAKIDDAIKALQAAIKGLEEKAGAKNGLQVEDGKTYVYKDGEKVNGVQKVDGKLYYASAKDNHVMKGGWINAGNGKKVYADKDGVLLTGYQKIGGKAYYLSVNDGHALKNGKVNAGKGVQYVAGADGVLAAGLAKVPSGEQYYCSVKDNHIMKAPAGKGTASVTGPNNVKYLVNEKGVVVG